jgi:hypothetical protein
MCKVDVFFLILVALFFNGETAICLTLKNNAVPRGAWIHCFERDLSAECYRQLILKNLSS